MKPGISLIFALLSVCSITACGGGSSESSSSDACTSIGLKRVKIANAEICSVGSTPAETSVVRLTINNDGTCTGSLIAKDVVLTAAHCFLEGYDGGLVIDTFAGSANGVSVLIAPAYDPEAEVPVNDAALVFLDREIPASISPLLLSRVPVIGENAVIAGYGEYQPDELDDRIRAGSVLVENLTNSHIFVSFQGNQSHPCRGDSGGPLLIPQSGGLAIAGVVSQSDPQVDLANICKKGDVTLYTNIQRSDLVEFITSNVPDVGVL